MEKLIIPAIIAMAGFFIGSFLNVAVDRLPFGKNIIKSRSICDYCKKILNWTDLIPLFSYIRLQGKCRYCKKKLSLYYPIIETTTALIYFTTSWYLMNKFDNLQLIPLLLYLIIASCLIIVFFSDLKYGIIPDKVIVSGVIFVFVLHLVESSSFLLNIYSAFITFVFFLFLFLITKGKGMGFGDVKFAFLMGFMLRFPEIIVSLYMAFLTGAIVSIILILWKGKHLLKKTIPFGPLLSLSAYVSFLWGDLIWQKAISLLF